MTTVIRFEISYTQYVNHKGEIVQDLPKFAHDSTRLLSLYRMMVLTRLFDQKAISLQRTGKLGTYASSLGQEAISVAIGDAMHPEDVLLPPYREYGLNYIAVSPSQIFCCIGAAMNVACVFLTRHVISQFV